MGKHRTSFARAKATRLPKVRFLIYCEGENTEPVYFKAFELFLKSAIIDVQTEPTGVPMSIARAAVDRARQEGLSKGSVRKPKDSFAQLDQVWAVFDRDDHPGYSDAIQYCADFGVKVGRSNPCFEVWLILHQENFDRPDHRNQVCRHLQKLQPEYDPDGSKKCDWIELLKQVEVAEQRASRQLLARENEGDPFGPPSTTVGELSLAIRKAAEASQPK
jgi:hypothetical protein